MPGSGDNPLRIETAMGARTWALLLVLSIVWGCTFGLVKMVVVAVPPLTLVFLRVSIAAAALWCVLKATGAGVPRGREVWKTFFLMGLLNSALPWSLFFWGQQSLPSSLGAILNATTPLFSVLVGHFFLADERMRANRLAGVVVGFIGVATLIGPSLLMQNGPNVWAELAFILAALSYAFSGVVGRRVTRYQFSPVQAAFCQLTAASILIAPVAMAIDQPWRLPAPDGLQIASVLGLALVATAMAFILFFRILARAGATNVMLVTLLVPVTAILVGALVFGERLEPRNFLGMGFIALGLGLIDGRPLNWLRARLFAETPARQPKERS